MDILLALPILRVSPDHLRAAIDTFFQSCEDAGWAGIFHAKFHWLCHLPQEMQAMGGFLPSCFTQERKHKTTKKYATGMQNLRYYNRSILEEIAVQDLYELQHHDFSSAARLVNKGACSKKLLTFLASVFQEVEPEQCFCCSKAFLSPAGSCGRGDIVLLTEGANLLAAEVLCHFEICGSLWTLVDKTNLDTYSESSVSAKWQKADGHKMFVQTEMVKCAVMWSGAKGNSIVTIIPLHLRHLMS